MAASSIKRLPGVLRAGRACAPPLHRRAPRVPRAADAAAAEATEAPAASNGAPAHAPVPAAAAAPAPISPEAFRDIVPPAKNYETIVALGAARTALPWQKCLYMGVLAGIYIGLGGLLLMTVGGACPGLAASNPGLHKMVLGSFGLPVGLILVMVCGAELFTGNVLFMSAACVEGKATPQQVLSNWALSFTGNLIGALLLVALVSATGLMATSTAPINVAVTKTSLTLGQAFSRAILANAMVCMAVWMATACNSFPGKFMAAWVAVSTFSAIGFEHSIANAFMIPMGIAVGAPLTFGKFLSANLIPVTLGNIVGGVFLALSYGFVYGRLGKSLTAKAA